MKSSLNEKTFNWKQLLQSVIYESIQYTQVKKFQLEKGEKTMSKTNLITFFNHMAGQYGFMFDSR